MRKTSIVVTIGEMHRRSCTIVREVAIVFVLIHLAGPSAADALPDHDNGPLTGLFGLPESTENGTTISQSEFEWVTSLITASHNINDVSGVERLRADGETTRFALTLGYGLADNFDISIEVPYLWHQSGNLDSLIDEWHDVFGFPGGSRRAREHDRLEFSYTDLPSTLVRLTDNTHGIGDIRLMAGWQLSETENHRTALRLGIKLPTGDSDDFLGSGGTDLSFGIAGDVNELWDSARISGFYRANITYLGEPDVLVDRYNDLVGQLSFGLSYGILSNMDLTVQSRLRSAVYDSEIESLGRTSMSLNFGARIRVGDRYQFMIAVGEDIIPGTVPDVSFQIAFGHAGR